jgi:hypothetical protein
MERPFITVLVAGVGGINPSAGVSLGVWMTEAGLKEMIFH